MAHSWKEALRAAFSFTRAERRRILYLLPLLVVVSLVVASLGRPRFERSFPLLADARIDSVARRAGGTDRASVRGPGVQSDERTETGRRERDGGAKGELFGFDPNTVTKEELVRLGFTPRQAQGILNYRAAGKRFYEAEDFADCYTVSDEMYARLEPYIRIARPKRPAVRQNGPVVPPPVEECWEEEEPAGPGMNGRQKVDSGTGADAEVRPGEGAEDRGRVEATSGGDAREATGTGSAREREAARRPRVELNGAGMAALDSVRGIGALTAGRIIAYRQRLGGFADIAQLQEVEGMTERNYELICEQIWVDSSVIQKIDINFAPPEELLRHPYLTAPVVRKILKNRQLKGGWRTLGDMIDDKTVSQQQAAKLAPYLSFGPGEGR
ncbi:MAG: helix-hairpin-helix domain-containing protein [Rikenellaceae bacterium]|nr:helix-hairpin-helix domain-containing protein [Rikenellaceae bacterium]